MNRTQTHSESSVPLAAATVTFALAVSAGVHAGLTPMHLEEAPMLGAAFVLATIAAVAVGVAVAIRPHDFAPAAAAALLLSGLVLAYTASRTTGIPLLEPDPEPLDSLGLVTQAVQLLGVVCALWIAQPARQVSAHEIRAGRGATLVAIVVVVLLSTAGTLRLATAGVGHGAAVAESAPAIQLP
jgi:hypothetical protein